MAIVLKRLHGILENGKSDSSLEISEALPKGSYSEYLEKQTTGKKNAFFKLLVEEDASLVLEYNSLRALLEKILKQSSFDASQVTDLVREALDLTILIEKKYDHYINERPNLRKSTLQSHRIIYRQWLNENDSTSPLNYSTAPFPYASTIRTTTENAQPYRLSFIRSWRFLKELKPVINDLEHYSNWINWADKAMGPVISYLGLVFFVPRLLSSLLMLWMPVMDCSSLNDPELWSLVHFQAQWSRLWPNITNDVAWVLNGILMCFVCIGSLQPMAAYLTFVMQLYDAVMSCLRTYWELGRFAELLEGYKEIEDEQLLGDYLACLNAGIEREKTLLYLSVVNFVGLFVAAGLFLPIAAAANPLFPVVGAIIALAMTAINFGGRDYLTQQTPHWLSNYIGLAINASGCASFKPPPADGLDELLTQKKNTQYTVESRTFPANKECNLKRSELFASSSLIASQGILANLAKSRSCPSLFTESPKTIAISMSGDALPGSPRLHGSPKPKCERGPSTDSDYFIGDYASNKW